MAALNARLIAPNRKVSEMEELSVCLQREVDLAVHRLQHHQYASQVLDGTASAETLAGYYVTAYEAVRNAPSFLRQSHDQLRQNGGHPELIALLGRKVHEESGHDQWLLSDLTAIGYPPERVDGPRAAPAAALYNSFHQQVIAMRGEAFLGSAWILESLSLRCAGVAATNLRLRSGIAGLAADSAAGLRFLLSHHDADTGHVAELAGMLGRLVTEPAARDYVLLSARFTATVYADFFAAP
jgi:pyrroloquinoline quinone (PQQ) biosynthesis protein C